MSGGARSTTVSGMSQRTVMSGRESSSSGGGAAGGGPQRRDHYSDGVVDKDRPAVDRSTCYADHGTEPDKNLETLSQRLAADLRRQIKRLGTPTPLSPEWFNFVESLQHIANIAVMEQTLPAGADDATLWERDDLTVRYMLEEGKLNVTLRSMVTHRNFLRRKREFEEKVVATAAHHKVDRAVVESRIRTAEKCTGQLLRCCFAAVESLQTTDMPLLIRYVASILANVTPEAFQSGGGGGGGGIASGDADKYQETQVLYYCHSVFAKHLGALNEDQVMGYVRDEGVFARLAAVLDKHGAALVPEALDHGLLALSGMCGTEFFSIHGAKEMVLADDKYSTHASLKSIKDNHLGRYLAMDPAERKGVQALLDTIAQLERVAARPARPARPQSGRLLADRIRMLSGG